MKKHHTTREAVGGLAEEAAFSFSTSGEKPPKTLSRGNDVTAGWLSPLKGTEAVAGALEGELGITEEPSPEAKMKEMSPMYCTYDM